MIAYKCAVCKKPIDDKDSRVNIKTVNGAVGIFGFGWSENLCEGCGMKLLPKIDKIIRKEMNNE